jgi:hypothetical protein
VAERQEVFRRDPAGGELVGGDDGCSGDRAGAHAGDDHGQVVRDDEVAGFAGHQDAVDAERDEVVERVRTEVAVRGPVGERQPEAVRGEGRPDAVEEWHVPGVPEVVDDDPDRAGAVPGEDRGGAVRSVAEGCCGLEHGLATRSGHPGVATEHHRDEGLRHARAGGDVDDRGRTRHGRANHVLTNGRAMPVQSGTNVRNVPEPTNGTFRNTHCKGAP